MLTFITLHNIRTKKFSCFISLGKRSLSSINNIDDLITSVQPTLKQILVNLDNSLKQALKMLFDLFTESLKMLLQKKTTVGKYKHRMQLFHDAKKNCVSLKVH